MTSLPPPSDGSSFLLYSNVFQQAATDNIPIESSENNRKEEARENDNRPSSFVIQATLVASLGGILFGYDLGVISGALPQLIEAFDLSSRQQEIVVSILYVGGGLGAALGGSLCDFFGRKQTILITDSVFLVGALVLASAPTFECVLVGRVIVGFGIAVSGIADVSYLHEIAPIQWRGAIVSVNEACISLGFLLAFAVGSLLSYEGNSNGWRVMFGASGLVALAQLLGMLHMPESPVWLRDQGRIDESEAAMRRINPRQSLCELEQEEGTREGSPSSRPPSYNTVPNNEDALTMARHPRHHEHPIPPPVPQYSAGIVAFSRWSCSEIFFLIGQLGDFAVMTMRIYRKQAYIALFLAVAQQFCGQTNVLSYAPLIFSSLNNDGTQSSSSFVRTTLSIGLVKFAVTVLVIWKIEKVGRRFLLLTGLFVIASGLALLTIAFGGANVEEDWEKGQQVVDDRGNGFALALPGVLLVVCGYSMSFGPLTWLLTSEIFPTEIRGRALGTSTIVTYLSAAVVTSTFLSAQEWIGTSPLFGLYLLVTVLSFLFAFVAVPETKEKTVEQIETDLDNMLWWRTDRHLRQRFSSSPPLIGTELVSNNDESDKFTTSLPAVVIS